MAARATLTVGTVAAVVEVLVSGLAHVEDFAREMEMLARHIVVEVHLHVLVTNLTDDTGNRTAIGGLHHQLGTDFHHIHQHIIFHKHVLVEVHDIVLVALAVALFGGQVEGVLVAGFLAHQVLLELGQQLVHSENADKRILFGGLLQDGTIFVVFAQDIGHGDDGLILDFHNMLVFKDLKFKDLKFNMIQTFFVTPIPLQPVQ